MKYKKLTIIGDVHGNIDKNDNYDRYYKIASGCERSFQLGDFGYSPEWNRLSFSDLDPDKHKVGQGNHDDHSLLVKNNPKHFVGRYGKIEMDECKPFYWIGGALSIDMVYKVGEWYNNRSESCRSWWSNEQLSFNEMLKVLSEIKRLKPTTIISHTAPSIFIEALTSDDNSSDMMDRYGWGKNYHDMTSQLMDEILLKHRPATWICGHFHKNYSAIINNTKFVCISELSTYEI